MFGQTKLDKKQKNRKLSDINAVLNKKCASPSQTNRVMAKILVYLGYEVRLVKGQYLKYKDTAPYNTYLENREWCEIKINGKWYYSDVLIDMYKLPMLCAAYPSVEYYYKNGKHFVN